MTHDDYEAFSKEELEAAADGIPDEQREFRDLCECNDQADEAQLQRDIEGPALDH